MKSSPSIPAAAKPARFSKQTLDFITKASRQKSPEWLDRNRSEYEKYLLDPLKYLALQLKRRLGSAASDYHFPQKGLARIKRSANRAAEYGGPFKDWVSYSAARPRTSRFDHNPNIFFLIQPGDEDGDDVLIAGGLYMPSSRQLRAIREAISTDSSAFESLFRSKAFSHAFQGGFSDERIATRPPRGFDPNHPKLHWLKLQAFFVWKSYAKKAFYSPGFADQVASDGAQILRLNALLEKAIQGRLPRTEPKKKEPLSVIARLEGVQAPLREMDF